MYLTYALVDPRDGRIFYVGCTTQDLFFRFRQHIRTARRGREQSVKEYYIRALLSMAMMPRIILLDKTGCPEDARASERHFIKVIPYLTNSPRGTRSSRY